MAGLLTLRRQVRELEDRVVELEAEVAGERAKGVLLQRRAERAEAAQQAPADPKPVRARRARKGT